MTTTTTTVITTTDAATNGSTTKGKRQAAAALPKSVAKRLARQRFSFGPTWNHNVIAGTVTDKAKLLAQAEQLEIKIPADIEMEALKTKVALKLVDTFLLAEKQTDEAAA